MSVNPKDSVDGRAEALLARVAARMKSLKSLCGDRTYTVLVPHGTRNFMPQERTVSAVRLMRPNFIHAEEALFRQDEKTGEWKKTPYKFTRLSDGKNSFMVNWLDRSYEIEPTKPTGEELNVPIYLWRDFFESDASFYANARDELRKGNMHLLRYQGKQDWEGAAYHLIEQEGKVQYGGDLIHYRDTLFIGADDLIHRHISRELNDSRLTSDEMVRNVCLNEKLEPSDFKVVLPPGVVRAN